MRALHGVTSLYDLADYAFLKQKLLLFDHFHALYTGGLDWDKGRSKQPMHRATMEFLMSRGVLRTISMAEVIAQALERLQEFPSPAFREINEGVNDFFLRVMAGCIWKTDLEAVAICSKSPPDFLQSPSDQKRLSLERVIHVGVHCLPVPGEGVPLDAILEFKQELHDKRWTFRRFLRQLATKPLSEGEIQDELEFLVHQYKGTMNHMRMRRADGFFEVVVIPAIEIAEHTVKGKVAKLATMGIEARERRIQLIEEELRARGSECAYIFDSHSQFGSTDHL
jgi:hypothetical protein